MRVGTQVKKHTFSVIMLECYASDSFHLCDVWS